MAKSTNERRARNRAEGRRMEGREEGHREPRYEGEGREGEHSNSSGSYAHRGERVGPGSVPGAGELLPREAAGSREDRVRMPEDRYPNGKTPGAQSDVRENDADED